jgi:hypothetical protein
MVGMAFNAPAVIDMLNGRSVRSSRTDMMDELYLAQEDGGLPTTLAADSAPVRSLDRLTLVCRREGHPREPQFLDARDEHAVGSEMRDHLGIDDGFHHQV